MILIYFTEGDDVKNENRERAVEMFEKVVEMESARGNDIKWRFKALQELVILYFKLGKFILMIQRFQMMLSYISSVTRNECTDAINAVLDAIASVKDVKVLSEMYELTLASLKSANNERLWFNTNLKLAKAYLDSQRYNDVDRIVMELKRSCQLPDGSDDTSKGTSLLEVYCLEIQLCTLTRQTIRMKTIYPRTLHLNAAVADPRIMGIIREEGGKMHMSEGNWDDAYNELYEAFRNYQEAGNAHAKSCLKYVVLASMLALSDINPFAAPEAKVYADDREILAMAELRQTLESNDLDRFEKILQNKQNRILDEPFLMTYIQPLRRRMKEQVLINLTKPYRKVTLDFLSSELALTKDEVELLLVDMILDQRIDASIDQIHGVVILGRDHDRDVLLDAIDDWSRTLIEISTTIINRAL
jgi:COP9 signalosome complex subunit 2